MLKLAEINVEPADPDEMMMVSRQEFKGVLLRISDLEESDREKGRILKDVLTATGLSEDSDVRRAQLSISAWVGPKIGWWIGALSLMPTNKELIGPSMTYLWNIAYPLQRLSEAFYHMNPQVAGYIQDGAPWVIGFMVGGEVGMIAGRRFGTNLALKAPEGSRLKIPANEIIPDVHVPEWMKALNPLRLTRRMLAFSPIFNR